MDKNHAFSNIKGAEEGHLRPVFLLQGGGSARVHFGDFREGFNTGFNGEDAASSVATRGCAEAIQLHHQSMCCHDMRSIYSLQHIAEAKALHDELEKKLSNFPADSKQKELKKVHLAQEKIRAMFANPCLDIRLVIEGEGVPNLLRHHDQEAKFLRELSEKLHLERSALSLCYPSAQVKVSGQSVHSPHLAPEDALKGEGGGFVVIVRVTHRGYSIIAGEGERPFENYASQLNAVKGKLDNTMQTIVGRCLDVKETPQQPLQAPCANEAWKYWIVQWGLGKGRRHLQPEGDIIFLGGDVAPLQSDAPIKNTLTPSVYTCIINIHCGTTCVGSKTAVDTGGLQALGKLPFRMAMFGSEGNSAVSICHLYSNLDFQRG